jgi:hypothetical protein
MKKNEAKKLKTLRLSKETLRSLTAPEIQMAVGASGLGISCQTNCNCAATLTESPTGINC